MLCKHSVLAVLERVQMCSSKDDKENVYKQAIDFCNPNWHRKTYDSRETMWYVSPPPPRTLKGNIRDDGKYISRFKEIVRLLPPKVIHQHLSRLECLLLEPGTETRDNDGILPTSSTKKKEKWANPPKRRKFEMLL